MKKEDAIAAFCQKNKIDIQRAMDVNDINCDPKIVSLSEQVDCWLSGIAAEDHDVFLELLSRYTYLTKTQCRQRYQDILNMLNDRLGPAGITQDEILFIAMEAGGAYASGGEHVRADLQGYDLSRFSREQLVAAQSRLTEDDIRGYKAVVFLDDIVSSGITMWNGIRGFCDAFPASSRSKQLFFACIIPRAKGIRHVQRNCRKFHISVEPLYREEWLEKAAFQKNSDSYRALCPYEEMIGNYMMQDKKSFFMGFQTNRLLVSFYYNTPNNTLCTFWRAAPTSLPLFQRRGDQALSPPKIADLKMRKQQMCRQAYAFGCDRRRNEFRDGTGTDDA